MGIMNKDNGHEKTMKIKNMKRTMNNVFYSIIMSNSRKSRWMKVTMPIWRYCNEEGEEKKKNIDETN